MNTSAAAADKHCVKTKKREKCLEKENPPRSLFTVSGTAGVQPRRCSRALRFCPTRKCHIQFCRHSIGSLLTLRVERLLLFGSYFCGSGRSCGQNMELVDCYILGWSELGGRWAAARPPKSLRILGLLVGK